jgi:hypothetical protein
MNTEGNERDEEWSAHGVKAQPSSVAQEFYRRQDLAADSNAEDFMQILMDENQLNRAMALSVMGTILEHRALLSGQRDIASNYGNKAMAASGSLAAVDVGAVRQALIKVRDIESRCFLLYLDYVKNHGNPDMAWRCLMLLLDYPEAAGADTMPGLMKLLQAQCREPSQHRALKATLHKCLQFFQRKVPELPQLPGQRSPEAREKMRNAQKRIWRTSVTLDPNMKTSVTLDPNTKAGVTADDRHHAS